MSLKQVTRKPVIMIGLGLFLLSCFIGTQSFAEETTWHGYIDSATYVREEVGLSKARIAAQLEAYKPLGDIGIFKGVSLNTILRVSYDGVYELNDTEFGDKAGGPILLDNQGVPGQCASLQPTAISGPGSPRRRRHQQCHGHCLLGLDHQCVWF